MKSIMEQRHEMAATSPRPAKAPTPASWKPGQSGNPKGRPRKGSALAEAIRAKCDPDELATIALTIARSEPVASVKLQALMFLASAGFVRPEQRHELVVGAAEDSDAEDLSGLSLEQLRELAELEARRATILADRAEPAALPAGEGV